MKKIIAISFLLFMAFALMAQEHRYGIKSGIAYTVTITNGTTTTSTQYFDEYGDLDCIQQHMEVPGLVSYDYYTITKGDTCWFRTDNGGTKKFKNPTPDLNFLNLTDAVRAKYKIQDLGSDTYLGRHCEKYYYETKQNHKTVKWTVWTYKGLIIKAHCVNGHLESFIEVNELEENVPVPPEMFETL